MHCTLNGSVGSTIQAMEWVMFFVANLISSIIGLLVIVPFFIHIKWSYNGELLKKMLRYSLPLLVLGVAGIMNQTFDKMMFTHLLDDQDYAQTQLGIYGACYKIGIVMMMFTQAFRYAYEPFVFAKQKNVDNNKAYSDAMKYFYILSVFLFLGVTYFLDLFSIPCPCRLSLRPYCCFQLFCFVLFSRAYSLIFHFGISCRTRRSGGLIFL